MSIDKLISSIQPKAMDHKGLCSDPNETEIQCIFFAEKNITFGILISVSSHSGFK